MCLCSLTVSLESYSGYSAPPDTRYELLGADNGLDRARSLQGLENMSNICLFPDLQLLSNLHDSSYFQSLEREPGGGPRKIRLVPHHPQVYVGQGGRGEFLGCPVS